MTAHIDSVASLIAAGHINDVRFLAISANVRDEPDESLEDDDVTQDVQLQVRKTDTTIEFRLSVDVRTQRCEYAATAATQVEVDEGVILDAVLQESAARIGFTVVYPYLREAVQSASVRLRIENIVIPLVDPESIRMTTIPVRPET